MVPMMLKLASIRAWQACSQLGAAAGKKRAEARLIKIALGSTDKYLISFRGNGDIVVSGRLSAYDIRALGVHRKSKLRTLGSQQQAYMTRHRHRLRRLDGDPGSRAAPIPAASSIRATHEAASKPSLPYSNV